METGKIINRISNRLQRFAPDTQNRLGIGQAQAIILRFLLVEGQKRDIYQVDIADCRQSPGICRNFYYEHCFSGIIELSERRCFL